ncbi:HNH endonuclease [Paraconexibacter sp. AEG42_29]|uniref:HNH endonuclease n=1 Tax=Paraconexibacter sp. AEG42_29 TaxID=2997339 RepID=A0AAU7B1Z6_9ACTN
MTLTLTRRPTTEAVLAEFVRDDAGTPLGARAGSSGRPLRTDGQSHYDAWLAQLRREACAYCGAPGGTVDHVEPRSQAARGLGGAHSWLNVVGACGPCNQSKRDLPLLEFLRRRARR